LPVLLLAAAALSAQTGQQAAGKLNVVKPAIADSDLVIELAEITENALFFPVDVGGDAA
jgi:hypothetical protein